MRKTWIILVSILSFAIVFGIAIFSVKISQNNKPIYATRIDCDIEEFKINTGSHFKLNKSDFNIYPQNCTEDIWYESLNDDICSVDKTSGIINAINCGLCELKVYIKSGQNKKLELTINVRVVNDNVEDKIFVTKNITCSISNSNGVVFVDLGEDNDRDTLQFEILEGNDSVFQNDIYFDFNRIIIPLKTTGNVTIIVSSSTKNICITLEIQD